MDEVEQEVVESNEVVSELERLRDDILAFADQIPDLRKRLRNLENLCVKNGQSYRVRQLSGALHKLIPSVEHVATIAEEIACNNA